MQKQIQASLKSENFWSAIVMILAAIFIGFPTEAGLGAENLIIGLLATVKAFVTWLKSGIETKPKILEDTNFWYYLSAAAVAIIPGLPPELFSQAQAVVTNLISGEWQTALIAGIGLITILIKFFKKKEELKPAAR